MPDTLSPNHTDPAILYPELNPEQQQEATYYFARYIELVRRIFERNYEKLRDLTKERGRP